ARGAGYVTRQNSDSMAKNRHVQMFPPRPWSNGTTTYISGITIGGSPKKCGSILQDAANISPCPETPSPIRPFVPKETLEDPLCTHLAGTAHACAAQRRHEPVETRDGHLEWKTLDRLCGGHGGVSAGRGWGARLCP